MDTFRKWLNKPKADDKSLLARFYHADRSLTAVASELDSFDGRAEPDRCSRLVSRLRQGQDKVLAITNLIMEELLGEDRDPRAFRVKFPEEVLQENLAGQLWFGAECLAAGSSIMNREQESKEMRPLAQAVTKSLGNVRNLLRDQCLRNNVPNSRTLHLDINDSTTEQLYESLKIFDRLFAEFELRYVSAMVQVKTKQEYEMQELICVLFSETLRRALTIGLIEQEKVDVFDPALMFSIPRLAIIAGLVVYPKGPLNMDMPADQLSEMFRPFRTILVKIRDLLKSLSKKELLQLEKLLCTNEDIHMTIPVGTSSIEAPSSDQQNNNNLINSVSYSGGANYCGSGAGDSNNNRCIERSSSGVSRSTEIAKSINAVSISADEATPSASHSKIPNADNTTPDSYKSHFAQRSPSISSVSVESSVPSTPTASPSASPTPSQSLASTSSVVSSSTTSVRDWTDEDVDDEDLDEQIEGDVNDDYKEIVDCASGYLIPNTNFGNLLQPQEVPLTDNFIANEDEFSNQQLNADDADVPTTSAALNGARSDLTQLRLSGDNSSEQSGKLTIKASSKSSDSSQTSLNQLSRQTQGLHVSCDNSTSSSNSSHCRHVHREHCCSGDADRGGSRVCHRHHHNNNSYGTSHYRHSHPQGQHNFHHHHHHRHHHHRQSRNQNSAEKVCCLDACQTDKSVKKEECLTACSNATMNSVATMAVSEPTDVHQFNSSVDTSPSSSLSEDEREVSLALKAAGRLKFKSTENLLHRLFVCIAGVADQLQTNFASDLRQILRSVFLMNMSTAQEEFNMPEKAKESDLFEFRASENDVLQESGGSNQSIYSAEEVNPELDNVFNNNSNISGNSGSSGSSNNSNSSGSSNGNGFNNRVKQFGETAAQRGITVELGSNETSPIATLIRSSMERSRSLGDQENNEGDSISGGSRQRLSSYINGRRLSSPSRLSHGNSHSRRNRNNSEDSNSHSSASSSPSELDSPVSTRVSVSYTHSSQHSSVGVSNNNALMQTTSVTTAHANTLGNSHLSPPAWVPDDKAPFCMSCRTPFTAFRRRHHCRNCGGVFCGVCSNASAPLPKYGLTKAVRVCRDCFVHEIRATQSHQLARSQTATIASGS